MKFLRSLHPSQTEDYLIPRHPQSGWGGVRPFPTLFILMTTLLAYQPVVAASPAAAPAAASSSTWRYLPDQPEPLSGRFAGVSHGALILAGGSAFKIPPYDGGKKLFSDQIDVLASPAGPWIDGGKLERPLAQGIAVSVGDSLVCLGGGDLERSYASAVRLRWNGERLTRERLPDLPSPCAFGGAAAVGNTIYVAGGIATTAATEALHTFWKLDLDHKPLQWETLPVWPGTGRLGAAVAALDGDIYVVSGASLHPGADGKPARTYLTDGYRYRPGKGWERIADIPGGPAVAAPALAAAGRLFIFGGDSGADAARAAELRERHPGFRRDILTYDPTADRWTVRPGALPVGLVTTNAVRLGDSLVIPGGEDRPGHRSVTILARPIADMEKDAMTAPATSDAALPQTPIFVSGENGYHTFRIPALLTTKRGVLLAFAEGRRDGAGDAGAIDMLLRRSIDGGKTWEAIQTVWADGINTCGNACPVLDEATGAVSLLLTHNLGQDHEKDIMAGTSVGTRTVWLIRSEDDGATWTKPQEITATTKKPGWGWYATGPGIGIQIRKGAHKGRLVVPCDHSDLANGKWTSHAIYSDDGGKSWTLGGICPHVDTNECQVAELPDGRLVLNMRSADKTHKYRSVCYSSDGGETWTDFHYDDTLIEPICQASLLALPGDGTLVFSNPASQTERKHLTLRLSSDGGKTWSSSRELYAGPAAYSSLNLLPDGSIGCLYECGTARAYDTISLAIFTPDWVRTGKR